ncbi:MAG: hypothetical protein KC496_12215 [Anaerolineae bacterium]|nr:hypothetical protein [Anaerolineae bacterium]
MPKRQKLQSELKGERDYGVFLAAQMGGVPEELQLMIQTAQLDEQAGGLRPRGQYVVRVLGVKEHRASLGVFGNFFFAEDHPLLFHYNEPRQTIHFSGKPADIHELVLDIHQAYVTTFGPWRELAGDINRTQPLVSLLASGEGVLGVMPQPVAERVAKVFAHHKMTCTLDDEPAPAIDDHGRSQKMKLLGIGDSYFVAMDYSVDEIGKI